MKLILAIVAIGIAVFLFRRSRQSRIAAPARATAPRRAVAPQRPLAQSSRFHAVSVACGKSACSAARAMGNTRILSSESPLLPLPDCDAAVCDCRFVHHNDRRRSEDRRDPYRNVRGGPGEPFRQFEKDRRWRIERRNDEPGGYFSA